MWRQFGKSGETEETKRNHSWDMGDFYRWNELQKLPKQGGEQIKCNRRRNSKGPFKKENGSCIF